MAMVRDAAAETGISEGFVPEQQFTLRAYVDLSRNVEATASLFGASAISSLSVPRYTKLDARLAWHPSARVELAVTAKNLFHDGDIEYIDRAAPVPLPVRSTLMGEIGWRF
jgi:iron complex outermembrane receptor protein